MAANTPMFGPKLDPDEHGHHIRNFEAEMYRFTDCNREGAGCVNVLHLGTDLGAVRPMMDRIVRFMGKWGYEADLESGLSLSSDREMFLVCSDADMLILGSDTARHVSARYVLRCVSIGWFCIVPYWDVLWYGTDHTPKLYAERPKQYGVLVNPPLCSGRKFALDGVCLAHAHIRRRGDASALRGAYAEMMGAIEGQINEFMGEARNDDLAVKIKKFETKVKNNGHHGPDAALFFAALKVLRNARNASVHQARGMQQEYIEKKKRRLREAEAEFIRLANKHKRLLLPSSPLATKYDVYKWASRLAHMAVAWLDEYSRMYAGP